MDGTTHLGQVEMHKVANIMKFKRVMICNIIEFSILVNHNSCEVGKKLLILRETLFLLRYDVVEGLSYLSGVTSTLFFKI